MIFTQAALTVVAILAGSHSARGAQVQPSQNELVWGSCAELLSDSNFPGIDWGDRGKDEVIAGLDGGCARLEFCVLPGLVYADHKFGYRMDGGLCLSPGPKISVKPGSTYGFVLCSDGDVNDYPDHPGTNLHTHGLHVAGSGNGDDITRHIYPGSCAFYEWIIPENHMGGTHWYHPHLHFHTEEQAAGGASGLLIVEDNKDPEKVIVDPSGAPGVYNFLTNEDQDLVILAVYDSENGEWVNKNQDNNSLEYNIKEDVWYRLRTVTVDADATPEIVTIPPECEAHAIAYDGVFVFHPPKQQQEGRYFLNGASRLDVAIKCNRVGTSYITITNGYARRRRLQGGPPQDGSHVIAVLRVSERDGNEPTYGPFSESGTSWDSYRPDYLKDLRNEPVDNLFSISFGSNHANGLEYDEQCPLKDNVGDPKGVDFAYNTVQEWILPTIRAHPTHTHVWHQQVQANCGEEHDIGEYYDSIASADYSPDCTVRFKTVRYGGRTTSHCHILKHEDKGAMGWVNVIAEADTFISPTRPCCISGDCVSAGTECIDENNLPNECALPWE